METSLTADNRSEIERLVNSLVVPRPIAWVTTVGASGINNLSPFSYFQVVSTDPVMVMISFSGDKHSFLNIQETGEFVVHSVRASNVDLAVMSSADVGSSVDEAGLLGLELLPSTVVSVPRLAISETAMECVLHSVARIGSGRVVFAEVVHIYIADELVDGEGRLAPATFEPVGRMGSNYYTIANTVRSINRPTEAELLEFDATVATAVPD